MELLDEEEVAMGIQVANERGEEERASEWAWGGMWGWRGGILQLEWGTGDVGLYG